MSYLYETLGGVLLYFLIDLLLGIEIKLLIQLKNEKKNWKIILDNYNLVYSFFVGYFANLSYGYLVTILFGFSKFLIFYIPIIFVITFYFILFYTKFKQNSFETKEIFNKIYDLVKKRTKNIIIFVFLIFWIYTFYKFKTYYIFINISHIFPGDAYTWQSGVYNLIKSGDFDYEFLGGYPKGFIVLIAQISYFIGGNPNMEMIQWICKNFKYFYFVSFFAFLYIILNLIFEKEKYKKLISICGTLLPLSFQYFIYRSLDILPTMGISFSSIFLILGLFKKNYNLIGMAFGSMILFHPLYSVIIIFSIELSMLVSLIYNKKKEKTFLNSIKEFLRIQKKVIILAGFALLIYLLELAINYIIIDTLKSYFSYLSLNIFSSIHQFLSVFFQDKSEYNLFSKYWGVTQTDSLFAENTNLNELSWQTGKVFITYGFILLLFIPKKQILPEILRNLSSIVSIFSIQMILFQGLPYYSLNLLSFITENDFYLTFQERFFEILTPFMIFAYLIWFFYVIKYITMKIMDRMSRKGLGDRLNNIMELFIPISVIFMIVFSVNLAYDIKPYGKLNVPIGYDDCLLKIDKYTLGQDNIIYYDTRDPFLEVLTPRILNWNNTLLGLSYHHNASIFNNFIQNVHDSILIVSYYNPNFWDFQSNFTNSEKIIYNNSNIIAVYM